MRYKSIAQIKRAEATTLLFEQMQNNTTQWASFMATHLDYDERIEKMKKSIKEQGMNQNNQIVTLKERLY
jgi:hypothetical protein